MLDDGFVSPAEDEDDVLMVGGVEYDPVGDGMTSGEASPAPTAGAQWDNIGMQHYDELSPNRDKFKLLTRNRRRIGGAPRSLEELAAPTPSPPPPPPASTSTSAESGSRLGLRGKPLAFGGIQTTGAVEAQIGKLAQKVRSQARELTAMHDEMEERERYTQLCERRLLQLCPGHALPITPQIILEHGPAAGIRQNGVANLKKELASSLRTLMISRGAFDPSRGLLTRRSAFGC